MLFARLLSKGSKEKRVADVLLSSTTENEEALRKRCSDVPDWLVDFAIGEYHLRNGSQRQALEAYQQSYQAIRQLPKGGQPVLNGLLHVQVRARLYQLSVASEPIDGMSAGTQVE